LYKKRPVHYGPFLFRCHDQHDLHGDRFIEVVFERELDAQVIRAFHQFIIWAQLSVSLVFAFRPLQLTTQGDLFIRVIQQVRQRLLSFMERYSSLALAVVDINHRVTDGAGVFVTPGDIVESDKTGDRQRFVKFICSCRRRTSLDYWHRFDIPYRA
jgi:hypothetical protein